MTIRIAQESAPIDKSHWRWSVWLDAPRDELDQIKDVVWKLHPTFSPSEVRVSERKTGFRLKSGGWGEFGIRAEIHRLDGEVDLIRHWLQLDEGLRGNDITGAVAVKEGTDTLSATGQTSGSSQPRRGPAMMRPDVSGKLRADPKHRAKVFLSYTQADARFAGILAEELRQSGITAFVDVDIPSGEDLRKWTNERITEADALVLLVSADAFASRNVMSYEFALAQKMGIAIIPVFTADVQVPERLESIELIRATGDFKTDAKEVIDRIREVVS
jgi:transcription initiation factor IIF auxiliary subunit